MPLDPVQSAPGNRISGPDGSEYDVVGRVVADTGPFVLIQTTDPAHGLSVAVLVSEGALRDHEDVAHVGSTADAKAATAADLQAEEDRQIAEDRQARIEARNAAEAPATDTTGTTGAGENPTQAPAATAPPTPAP